MTLEIKPGFYKTRDGRKARVLCTDCEMANYPNAGYFSLSDGRAIVQEIWRANGQAFGGMEAHDLIAVWEEPVKLVPHWAAIYKSSSRPFMGVTGQLFADEASAKLSQGIDFIRLATEYPPIMLPEETK